MQAERHAKPNGVCYLLLVAGPWVCEEPRAALFNFVDRVLGSRVKALVVPFQSQQEVQSATTLNFLSQVRRQAATTRQNPSLNSRKHRTGTSRRRAALVPIHDSTLSSSRRQPLSSSTHPFPRPTTLRALCISSWPSEEVYGTCLMVIDGVGRRATSCIPLLRRDAAFIHRADTSDRRGLARPYATVKLHFTLLSSPIRKRAVTSCPR